VSPTIRHQRCTLCKTANVLDKLPKSVQPAITADLRKFWNAPDRPTAETAVATFAAKYGARYEKAVTCLVKDPNALLTVYDVPVEHWDYGRNAWHAIGTRQSIGPSEAISCGVPPKVCSLGARWAVSLPRRHRLSPWKLADPRRFERPAFAFGGQRSIQLSYGSRGTLITRHDPYAKPSVMRATPRSRSEVGA